MIDHRNKFQFMDIEKSPPGQHGREDFALYGIIH